MRNLHTTVFALLFLALGTVGCQAGFPAEEDAYVPDEPASEENIEDIEDDEQIVEEEETSSEEEIPSEDETTEEDEVEEESVESFDEAAADFDTFDAPSFYFSFLGSGGVDTFTVTQEISAPAGDPHDWVAFTTPAPQNNGVGMTLSLDCEGDDSLRAVLWDDEAGPSPLEGASTVNCGQERDFYLDTSHDFLIRVFSPYEADGQVLTTWTLTVSS